MRPNTDDLPFLLLYGPWVWPIALAVAIAIPCVVVLLVRRRRAARDARAIVAQLEATPGVDVIRGTLGGAGSAPLVSTLEVSAGPRGQEPERAIESQRAAELWIDEGTRRIAIDADVVVLAGDRARAASGRVPRGTPPTLVTASVIPWLAKWKPTERPGAARLRSLAPGTPIVAVGTLERAPSDEATDYRTGATEWFLRPVAPDQPIAIAARRPAPGVVPLRRRSVGIGIAVAFAVGAFTLDRLGDGWDAACGPYQDAGDRARFVDVSNTHVCALAAATPGKQENAQRGLLGMLERHPYRDQRSLERLAALAEISDGCERAAALLLAADQYEAVIDVARRCPERSERGQVRGARRQEHAALVALGRFADAAALKVQATKDVPGLPTLTTLILAERWHEAAAAVEARAAELKAQLHQEEDRRSYELTDRHLACVATLLRHHGGDREALGRLRTAVAGTDGAACRPALAEAVPPDERVAMTARDEYAFTSHAALAGRMRYVEGRDDMDWEHESVETVLGNPTGVGADDTIAMALYAAVTPVDVTALPPLRRAGVLRYQALAKVFDGDVAAARELASQAMAAAAAVEKPDVYLPRDIPHLLAAVRLYTVDTDLGVDLDHPPRNRETVRELWYHDFGVLLLRQGSPVEDAYFGTRKQLADALVAAANGDGRSLAVELGTQDFRNWTDTQVMAIWPRLKTNRDAVARQLEWSAPTALARMGIDVPWSAIAYAATRRAALAMVGKPEAAARWDAIYRRYRAALGDRRRLVSLLLLGG